jgi:hypothetical protein
VSPCTVGPVCLACSYVYNVTNVHELLNGGAPELQEVCAAAFRAVCPLLGTWVGVGRAVGAWVRGCVGAWVRGCVVEYRTRCRVCHLCVCVGLTPAGRGCGLQLGPYTFVENQVRLDCTWSDDGDLVRHNLWEFYVPVLPMPESYYQV